MKAALIHDEYSDKTDELKLTREIQARLAPLVESLATAIPLLPNTELGSKARTELLVMVSEMLVLRTLERDLKTRLQEFRSKGEF